MALEELLIAEGSDWCWWYGPEHDSANRTEFDQLYRSHLANVYRFLNLTPPEELSRPILRVAVEAVRIDPCGGIRPTIDGEVTSYFEWIGAGMYRVDERSGSMHGKKFLVKEVYFGSDGLNLFLRADFHPGSEQQLSGMQARFTAQPRNGTPASQIEIDLAGGARACRAEFAAPNAADGAISCAWRQVLEVRIGLQSLGVAPGAGVRFQFSLWQGGLPIDAVPQQGWLEMSTTDPTEFEL